MTIKTAISITVFAAGLAASAALAQSWAPPTEIAPAKPIAAAPAAPAPEQAASAKPAPVTVAAEKQAPSGDEKKAKSKDCSAQADAKGLHGKERKKFRDQEGLKGYVFASRSTARQPMSRRQNPPGQSMASTPR